MGQMARPLLHMAKRKRALTLIEVVLSLGLIAMLLSSLVFLAGYMWRAGSQIKKERKQLIEKQLLWTRLEDALSRCTCLPKPAANNQVPLPVEAVGFSCDGEQLAFSFRPPISEVVELNTLQQARLYVDEGNLIFETGPSPMLWPEEVCQQWRSKQIWFQNIESLRIRLLHVPHPKKNTKASPAQILHGAKRQRENLIETAESGPQAGLNDFWRTEWDITPSALILEIRQVSGQIQRWPIWMSGALLVQFLPRESKTGIRESDWRHRISEMSEGKL